MLSVASVKSASGAANYFAKDDYYTAEHSSEATVWGGLGAAEVGLKGEVTKEAFEKILNGELPSGEKVGQVQNRQSGVDLTFSMPKSASVLAYVFGDERVLAAHMTAVKNTMTWVEQKFAEGRTYERTKSGEPVRTGNLVYAMFQHDTSRALDPQGHIHVLVANMTKMANGAWQALHNGQLWKNNTTIGAAYHAQFRAELAKLGYERASIEKLADGDAFHSFGADRRQGLWKVRGLGEAPLPLFAAADRTAETQSAEGIEPKVQLRSLTDGREVIEDYRNLQLSLRAHDRSRLPDCGVYSFPVIKVDVRDSSGRRRSGVTTTVVPGPAASSTRALKSGSTPITSGPRSGTTALPEPGRSRRSQRPSTCRW